MEVMTVVSHRTSETVHHRDTARRSRNQTLLAKGSPLIRLRHLLSRPGGEGSRGEAPVESAFGSAYVEFREPSPPQRGRRCRRRMRALPVAGSFAEEERGLGEILLRRDALHPGVFPLRLEQADRGGVAAECLRGESVDLQQPQDQTAVETFADLPYMSHTARNPTASTDAMQMSRY